MARIIGIGHQDFATVRKNNYFYIDKTDFIRQWWNRGDCVTLITRPRRFGKTLNMSMVEQFFSVAYAGKGELFEGLSIWEEEFFQKLQGSYPVIVLSFAEVKESTYSFGSLQDIYNPWSIINYLDKGKLETIRMYGFAFEGKKVLILSNC